MTKPVIRPRLLSWQSSSAIRSPGCYIRFPPAGVLRSTSFHRLHRYYVPLRPPPPHLPRLFIPVLDSGYNPSSGGHLRFLDYPLGTRCPLTPRGTGRLHMPVASSSILASPILGGWPSPSSMSGPESVHAFALRLAPCAFWGTVSPVARR